MAQYSDEVARRIPGGFDSAGALNNAATRYSAPAGAFILSRRAGKPVGCGALELLDATTAEIKRMWVAPTPRPRRRPARPIGPVVLFGVRTSVAHRVSWSSSAGIIRLAEQQLAARGRPGGRSGTLGGFDGCGAYVSGSTSSVDTEVVGDLRAEEDLIRPVRIGKASFAHEEAVVVVDEGRVIYGGQRYIG